MTHPHANLILDIASGLCVNESLKLVPREKADAFRYDAAVKHATRKYGQGWMDHVQIVSMEFGEWMRYLARLPRRTRRKDMAEVAARARASKWEKLPWYWWVGRGELKSVYRTGLRTQRVAVCCKGKRTGYTMAQKVMKEGPTMRGMEWQSDPPKGLENNKEAGVFIWLSKKMVWKKIL